MILHSPKDLALIAINQRKKLGLTQSEIADKVGLKQKTISAFETRPESVMLVTAFLILSALDLDINAISKKATSLTAAKWDQEW